MILWMWRVKDVMNASRTTSLRETKTHNQDPSKYKENNEMFFLYPNDKAGRILSPRRMGAVGGDLLGTWRTGSRMWPSRRQGKMENCRLRPSRIYSRKPQQRPRALFIVFERCRRCTGIVRTTAVCAMALPLTALLVLQWSRRSFRPQPPSQSRTKTI